MQALFEAGKLSDGFEWDNQAENVEILLRPVFLYDKIYSINV